MSRINLLLIDKDMNSIELDVPAFMLQHLNIDYATVKKNGTKTALNKSVNEFLDKFKK